MGVCYVADCPSRKSKTGCKFMIRKGASEEIRQAWVRNIPERDVPFDPDKHLLCEKHFEEELVEKEMKLVMPGGIVYQHVKGRSTLKKDAVPTIFGNQVISRFGRKRIVKRHLQIKKISRNGNKKKSDAGATGGKSPEKVTESLAKRMHHGYFCQLCLKVWYEETLQSNLDIRQEVYSKFTDAMSSHFQLNQLKSMCKPPVNFVSVGAFKNSLCNTCWHSSCLISKLQIELKEVQTRLNSEILKLIYMLKQPEFVKKKLIAEKLVAAKSLWDVFNFNERLMTAGSSLATYPKLILKRVDQINALAEKPIDISVTKDSEPDVMPTKFYGAAGIRRLLKDVVRCKSCDKSFLSELDLVSHQVLFHPKPPPVPADIRNSSLDQRISPTESNRDTNCETVNLDVDDHEDCESMDLDFDEDGDCESLELDLDDDGVSELVDLDLGNDKICETLDINPNNGSENQLAQGQSSPVEIEPTSSRDQTSLPTLVLNETLIETVDANNSEVNISVKEATNPPQLPRLETTGNMNEELQLEIKTEESEADVAPKKVPFMSSKFIGKYRVVCKLKNINTGETCVGVLGTADVDKAMPKVVSLGKVDVDKMKPIVLSLGKTDVGKSMPKVVSLGKLHQRSKPTSKPYQRIKIRGPPFICPVPDCIKQFDELGACKNHYRHHKRKALRKAEHEKRKQNQQTEATLRGPKISSNQLSRDGKTLSKTKKTKEVEVKIKLKCPVEGCYFKFCLKEALDSHLKTHTGHPCQFCDLAFYDPGSLMSHEIQHRQNIITNTEEANTNGIFDCPRCEGAFKAYRYLKQHYFRKHLKVNIGNPPSASALLARRCNDCDHEFSNLSKFHSHRRLFHGDTIDLPHSCPDCDKKFFSENAVKHHRRCHSTQTQSLSFQCHICPRMFHQRYKYELHVKSHGMKKSKTPTESKKTSGPFICDQCGRGFAHDGHLWMHMRVHENSSGPKFRCPVCNKFLISPGRLEAHMRSHTGEKPFVCHVCGDAFHARQLLGIHLTKKHPEDKC